MTLDEILADFQTTIADLAAGAAKSVLGVYARMVAGEISEQDAAALIGGVLNRSTASAATMAGVYMASQVEAATGEPALTTGARAPDQAQRLVDAANTILTEPPKRKMTRSDVREALKALGLDPADWDIAEATKITNESIKDSLYELRADADTEDWTEQDWAAAIRQHGTLKGVDFLERIVEVSDSPQAPAVWDSLQAGEFDQAPAVWTYEPEDASMRLERLARAEVMSTAQTATTAAMRDQQAVEGWVRHMDDDPCQLCRWWWREGRVWPKAHPFQSHPGCNCQPKIVVTDHIQSTEYTRRLERNSA